MEDNTHASKPVVGLKSAVVIGLAVLLSGAMVMAGNGNGKAKGGANSVEFTPPGQQTETVDFWVEFQGKLARKPNELVVITSKPDEAVEIGEGCLTGEPENVAGYHRVTVNHQGQLEGGAEHVGIILPKAVKQGSRLLDTTFVARCFSEVDEKLYDKFTAELNEPGNPNE